MVQLRLKKMFEGKQVSYFPIYLIDLAVAVPIKIISKSVGTVVTFYKKTDCIVYYNQKPWLEACDLAQKKLIEDNNFAKDIKQWMIEECHKLKKFSESLLKLKVERLADSELINLYKEFENRTLALRGYALVPNMVDSGSISIFTLAEKKISEQIGKDEKIKEYVSLLTTPEKILQQSVAELNLLKIQAYIKKKKITAWQKNKKVNQLIEEHLRKYGWIAYYYIGPAWNKKDMAAIIKNNLKLINDPEKKIKEIAERPQKIRADKERLLNKLKLNKNNRALLAKIAEMIYLKAYRKEYLVYSNFCFEPVLKEIGKRLGFNLAEIRFITLSEISKFLLHENLLTARLKKEIRNRYLKGCVSVAANGKIEILNLKDGNKKYLKYILEEKISTSSEIRGNTAYPGKVKAIAKIINLKTEVGKMKVGEILVSRSTNPDLVVAMHKAAAFVTDEGGITCHAAIVAREMKKPCIIGTKIATKVLKDGDLVEVDANKGIVKIIKNKK